MCVMVRLTGVSFRVGGWVMAMGSVGKRKAERRGCQVKAQVVRPDGSDPIECVILDFSATGARVKLNTQAELPARFKLYIPSRPETKSVILRWTKGLEFGVEYSTGVADEKTFFELIDRVAKLEKAGGGSGDPAALEELTKRIAALETARATANETDAPQPDADAQKADADRVDALDRRVDKIARTSEGALKRSEEFLSARMDQTEERLRALLAPDVAERLARLEAMVESGALAQAASPVEADSGPDPRIVSRIADLEARLMSAPRAPSAFDASGLEERIEKVARMAEERAERIERFLMTRIDDIETQMIAAPSAPAPTRSAEIVDLELKLHELAARFEREAEAPAQAIAPTPDNLMALAERVSDLEMSVMEMRLDKPAAQDARDGDDADLHRRIVEIEGRHAEIIGTLRNLLALLTAGEARRIAG